MLEGYYNRFDPAKKYDQHLFRAGYVLQSAELNEIQSAFAHRLGRIAGAVLREGGFVSGGEIFVDATTGSAVCEAGAVYVRGAVRDVPSASFSLPVTGTVAIGVRVRETVITEIDDPDLRDPAVLVRNYGEPGAGRLKVEALWGWASDAGSDENASLPFYPVATVVDGVLQSRDRPPEFDGVKQVIARYDFDANGHYIVSGLDVRFLERRASDGKLVFSLSSGVCNVLGYKVERPYDDRLVVDFDPDLQRVTSEPHAFSPDGSGAMRINLNYSPLANVVRVQGTKRKTVTVTHGVFSGATDTLPDATVVQVLTVSQGATTYAAGADYTVAGNAINWSPAGAEPAPGSTYSVTYDYIAQVTPTGVDENGFTVEGFVSGTLVQTDYDWRMPRVDALAIGRDGLVQRIKGVSTVRNPSAPDVPPDLLRLCDLSFSWRESSPVSVLRTGVRTVQVSELQAIKQDISRLFSIVSRDRLTQDITLREPASKYGVFADAFQDDDMRDAGVAQDAVIVDGRLVTPIAATVQGPFIGSVQTLGFAYRAVLEQTARTGSMKVNPYAAVEAAPAAVTLTPSQDFWTDFQQRFEAATTSLFIVNHGAIGWQVDQSVSVDRVARIESAIPTLRQITVAVRAVGFGGGEAVSSMSFDGVSLPVPGGLAADSNGVVNTSFVIPAGLSAGRKRFEIRGALGARGEATFVGGGTLVTDVFRTRVNAQAWRWDPLAQTFTLTESEQVAAVDLWFTVRGSRPVTVQIRETVAGVPSQAVLAEGRIEASAISTSGSTRIAFGAPVMLRAGVEYALVVLTDDTETACAVAELGKWDAANGRWVTSQAYQVGVLLSSSNASTWTAHQDKDLAFRLLGVQTTQGARSIEIASGVAVAGATDFIVLGDVDLPATGCSASVRLTLSDGRVFNAPVGTTVQLPAAFTGTVSAALDVGGTATVTPVVMPGWQLVVGALDTSATYVSRAVPAAPSFRIRVIAEVFAPGAASVTAQAESGTAGQWADLSVASAEPIGDGWVEVEWSATGLAGVGVDKTTRIKLSISNTPEHRAAVRNLRAVVA